MNRCQPVIIHFQRSFADLFLGAVLTNAQASIRGAALLGARHEAKFEGTPPFRLPWVSHLAARSGGVGVVRDCCEVGAKRRFSFLREGFMGSRVGECRWRVRSLCLDRLVLLATAEDRDHHAPHASGHGHDRLLCSTTGFQFLVHTCPAAGLVHQPPGCFDQDHPQ